MKKIVATIEHVEGKNKGLNRNDFIVITIRDDENNNSESTRFHINSLIKQYKDLNGVTIREGLFIKDTGIDELSAFINITVDFRRI